jgi:hypothetical protein
MSSDEEELDAVAAELYVLPPAEFTAARNARAADASSSVARGIRSLRKPAVAAYAVNLLARDGGLSDALELAAALRDAQDDLDAAELARLAPQRRALVAALAAQAAERAAKTGVAVSASAREAIEKTINAAVMDATAAAAVLSARLITPIEAGGSELTADAVGGSLPGVSEPAPRDDLAERRARKAAEKAAREADRAANEAQRLLTQIDARRSKAQERADHLAERIADLERDLARLEGEASAVDSDLKALEREHSEAAARARKASEAAERARDAL